MIVGKAVDHGFGRASGSQSFGGVSRSLRHRCISLVVAALVDANSAECIKLDQTALSCPRSLLSPVSPGRSRVCLQLLEASHAPTPQLIEVSIEITCAIPTYCAPIITCHRPSFY
jgi:hypothetical protein